MTKEAPEPALVCLWILDLVLGNKLVNGEGKAGEQVTRVLCLSLSTQETHFIFPLIHFPQQGGLCHHYYGVRQKKASLVPCQRLPKGLWTFTKKVRE